MVGRGRFEVFPDVVLGAVPDTDGKPDPEYEFAIPPG